MDSRAGGPNDPRDVLRKDSSITKKVLGYAYTKTRDITRVQDAAQEAMVRVLEGKGWYAWKPDAKSLLDHLCDVVDTVGANEPRRAGKGRERPIRSKDDEATPGTTLCRTRPPPRSGARHWHAYLRALKRCVGLVDLDPQHRAD